MSNIIRIDRKFIVVLSLLVSTARAQEGTDMNHPIDVGSCPASVDWYYDERDYDENSVYYNNYGGLAKDVWYRFEVDSYCYVNFSLSGSMDNTSLYLLNGTGQEIKSNSGHGPLSGTSLEHIFQPGTYYVVCESQSDSDNGYIFFEMSVEPVIDNSIGSSMARAVDVGVFTPSGRNEYQGSYQMSNRCNGYYNNYGGAGRDIWYRFKLDTACVVSLSHCESDLERTSLYLLDQNGYRIKSNSGNGPLCSGMRASLNINLQSGIYYIVTESQSDSDYGNIAPEIRVSKPGGSVPGSDMIAAVEIPIGSCGSTTFTDNKNNSGSNGYFNNYGQASPDVWYKVVLSSVTDLDMSLCGSSFDTYLHLLDETGGLILSNGDSGPLCAGSNSSIQTTLDPGTYYIVTEGNNNYTGNIALSVTATPFGSGNIPEGANLANAINAGSFSTSGNYSDSRSNEDQCLGNDIGQQSNDIYYKFILDSHATVSLSHCGSDFDTYMHLLNSAGAIIMSNDDNSGPDCPGQQSYIRISLDPGIYYVVSEGYWRYSGTIVTNIKISVAEACTPLASLPSKNYNYIVTYTPRAEFSDTEDLSSKSICEVQQTVEYFDGQGRLLQSLTVKGSPDGKKDIVVPMEYDVRGREAKNYLSYADSLITGSYKARALKPNSGIYAFYNPAGTADQLASGVPRTTTPFAETRYAPSPVNQIVEQGAPGADWQIGSGHTIRTGYFSNEDDNIFSENGRWAKQYGVMIDVTGVRTLEDEGSYAQNELYITEVKGENWKEGDVVAGVVQEFKDKQGRTLVKRVWKDEMTPLSTYYVYDDLGNLCFVLPPKAEPDGGKPNTEKLNNLCFQYQYDERNRLSAKKLPGKGWEYIIYNKLDRVVASQDGEQRKRKEWLVTRYDRFGRVIMTGISIIDISAESFKQEVYNHDQWDTKDSTKTMGYAIGSYPVGLNTVSTINYYDDYKIPALPQSYKRKSYSSMTQGLLTAGLTAVLNNPIDLLWNVNYYDDEGRVVKNIGQHYKGGILNEGNYDETDISYSFTDEILTSVRSHKVAGEEQVRIKKEYEYDHMGRLINNWETIGDGAKVLLVQSKYNEVGQLKEKLLHSTNMGSTFLQRMSYKYNERGWLKQINAPGEIAGDRVFGMNMLYNDHPDAAKRQYNGNISAVSWQTKVPPAYQSSFPQLQQSYDYSYDKLNRLLHAHYTTTGKAGYFDETVSYDKGGNILTLNRTGNNNVIDHLNYVYENTGQSNRLGSVSDGSGNNEGQASGTANYGYDDNGNLKSDSKKQISLLYNVLNLPKSITKAGANETITYLYDATGRKLRKEATGSNRDYIGGIEYDNNGNIEFIQTEEGRAVKSGSSYSYEYMLKDHLGNTRAVVKQDGSILQIPDYYAFGMEMNHNSITPSPDNRYKYNGKELQSELSLNQYDYGARFYDPVIARWNVIDPLAEKYSPLSPYNYAANNPVNIIDIDGRDIDPESQEEWDGQKEQVIRERDRLQRRVDKLTEKAEKKGWNGFKLAEKIGDKSERVWSLTQSIGTMGDLEKSSQTYSLKSVSGEFGGTSLDTKTKNIVFSFVSTANFVHEITHGGQFETGKIAYSSSSGSSLGQDIMDEVNAYSAQYAFNPSSVSKLKSSSTFNGITSAWVQSIIASDNSMPYSPGGTANTGLVPVNIDSPRNVLMQAYPNRGLERLNPNSTIRTMPGVYYK